MTQSTNYRALARQMATKYGVDPAIFERQIGQESGFNPNATSPAGATGIAQIMPQYHPGVDATDPEASLDYAARLMAGYLKQYRGDYPLALAAYNAGAGNVAKYGGVPPFEETQTYIANILGGQRAPQSGTQVAQAGISDFDTGQTPREVKMAGPEPKTTESPISTPEVTVKDRRVVWKDSKGNEAGPPTPGMPITGWGASNPTKHEFITFSNGEIWDVTYDAQGNATEQHLQDINAPIKSQWDKAQATAAAAARDAAKAPTVKGNLQWDANTGQWVAVPGMADPTSYRYDLNTTARYLPKQGANAQYDVGSSDYAGNAPPGWNTNPNYKAPVDNPWDKYKFSGRNILGIDPTTGLPMVVDTLPDKSTDDSVGLGNLEQRKREFDATMAWNKVKADMEREQADRTLQGQLYNHINNIWAQNLPRMGDPSQVYFAGAGPGGPLETLFKQGGSSYDPNQGKIAWQNFDPNAAWKQAAGMVRR